MRVKGEARENKGHEWFCDLQSGEEGVGGDALTSMGRIGDDGLTRASLRHRCLREGSAPDPGEVGIWQTADPPKPGPLPVGDVKDTLHQ